MVITAKGPRVLMSFDGSHMRVQNDDGSITIRDTKKNTGYRMRDGLVLQVEQPCEHKHTELYMANPDGKDIRRCLDCGALI